MVSESVSVDLHAVSLSDHRQARVFPNRETAVAYGQIVQTSPISPHSLPILINLVAGDSLNWDGKKRLRHAVGQILRRRRPLAVLVDDAQHLAIMGSGRKLLDQINAIKSIAN
jgi:hypothetical protein